MNSPARGGAYSEGIFFVVRLLVSLLAEEHEGDACGWIAWGQSENPPSLGRIDRFLRCLS